MFDFLKRLTKSKFADIEEQVEGMLKKKGMKTNSIHWRDNFLSDNPKHIRQAIIYIVDLETKEVTTDDVVKYGSAANSYVNHLKEGIVTFNKKTGETVLQIKKDDKNE